MVEKKQPYHEQVAATVIEALENGTAPWIKPWEPGQIPDGPVNAVTGKPYRGINRIVLAMHQGGADPRWCTYNQAQDMGAQVKGGSHGVSVQYWKFDEERLIKDDQGKPVLGETGERQYQRVQLDRPKVFFATVFHASQIENMPPLPSRSAKPEWERHAAAEKILKDSGANILHDQADRAFYRPSVDEIHLPTRGQFATPDKYYATALHEVGHWTGHESRLDRDISNPFGSEQYAREELRAELASYMLGADLGIGHDPGQHHAYIATWVQVLKKEPKEIIRAAQDAEKIMDYVKGLEKGLNKEEKWDGRRLEVARRSFTNPDRAAVQDAVINAVETNPKQFFERYKELPQSYDGRFICSDLFKETFPQYTESKETRHLYNTSVHNAAAVLAAEQFQNTLSRELEPSKNKVYMITGVPGSGKSTSVMANGLPPQAHAIYEGQLANPEVAVEKVGQALDAGLKPVIMAIHVKPEQALDNTLARFEDIGRPVSIDAMASIQGGLADGLKAVHERFGNAVDLHIIDRREFDRPKTLVGWQQLNTLESEGNYETIKGRLEAHLERRKPEISDTAWQQASGGVPIGTRGSGGRISTPKHDQPERPEEEGRGQQASLLATEKTWLDVPYKEKNAAKQFGASWDTVEKRWYAGAGTNLRMLEEWLPKEQAPPQDVTAPVVNPREEFGEKLREVGLVIEGDPLLDGKIHRVPVANGKPGSKDGAYCGYENDSKSAGWWQNHKSGEQGKWVATGHVVSPDKLTELKQNIKTTLADHAEEKRLEQEKAMKRVYGIWKNAELARDTHPYLQDKGIEVHPDLRRDKQGNLLIPAFNATGKLQTLQYVNPEGAKWYAENCPKSGAIFMFTPDKTKDQESKASKEIVLLAEGFATGASLHAATGLPVAVAFDAGNLKEAALTIRKKLPNAAITICADNDHKKENNVGVEKAKEAAATVGGKVIVPEFRDTEKAKGLTDFNDLYKSRGLKAVKEQVLGKEQKAEVAR